MNRNQRTLILLGFGSLFLAACGGGGATTGGFGGTNTSQLRILEVSNGFGRLLPYSIRVADANGLPTNDVREVRTYDDLLANLTPSNGLLPPTTWPLPAILPGNEAGNHFLLASFTQALDPRTVMSGDLATAGNPDGTNVEVISVDPLTGTVTPILGRLFVDGFTYGSTPDPNDATQALLERWVLQNPSTLELTAADTDPSPMTTSFPGMGFPGTEAGFQGESELVGPNVMVFVVDSDDDLSTHETFPAGGNIQMRIGSGIRSTGGRTLQAAGLAASTVGSDTLRPEIRVAQGTQAPMIVPGNGQVDVDPQTNIQITFTEPVQLLSVGSLDDGTPPSTGSSVQVKFGPSTAVVDVPFSVRPASVFDFTRFDLIPLYNFPGSGPPVPGVDCGNFSTVTVLLNQGQVRDLSGNLNNQSPSTFFVTREGPGLVNAPVTPDAIYVLRGGSTQGISVIDLNGFGAGTGNPRYDLENPIVKGSSNFPNNPNVALQGSLLTPPLRPGECSFNGGSSGPFSLVRDSSLNDIVAGFPVLESVGDMALGQALDNTFNNAQPFGCQAGGGNICAASGLKSVSIIGGGPNTIYSANLVPVAPIKTEQGASNLVSWAPHPNPPPLVFPPLCSTPLIGALEPTSIDTVLVTGLQNLLVPGPFPQGIPQLGQPPQGTLTPELNSFFEGPSPPQPNIQACQNYMIRQQIGHFLYVVDRAAGEVVVFNSNRFTVIDRIRTPDPTSLAMSPNLDFLAVSNQGADQISFIDIDPASANFHTIVKTTSVGIGPTGIAWDSLNEDIFVCNESEGTVTVVSAQTLEARKVVRNQLSRPIDVVVTPRQGGFGFARNVYFAYILNQNGTIAIFESGPDGVNGWGFDDVIGSMPFTFFRPKTLQPDISYLNSGLWVVHENPLSDANGMPTGQTGGAVTNVGISGGTIGQIPLDPGFFGNPQLRDLQFGIFSSVGEGPAGLSGIPVDIAFDNQRNLSGLTSPTTMFTTGFNISINGKALYRANGGVVPVSRPQFMFLAVPNPGVVDVFELSAGGFERVDTDVFLAGNQSIPVPNATGVVDYFRQ